MAVDPKSKARRNAERGNSGIMVAPGPEVASVPRLYAAERGMWRKFKRGGSNEFLTRTGEEQTDPRDFGWRLCLDGERSSKDRNRSRNERASACHWITSSARASTDGGIVRPRHTADHRSVGDRLRLHQGDGVAPEPTARRLMDANMPPHDRGHGKMSYLRQTILPRDEVHPPARLSPPARTPHL
jgi:hypothetical protein